MGPKEMAGLDERGSLRYIEQKFQQQLQRARGAFLQEFRNHSVVVDSEVRKIREELTEKLEKQHRDKIDDLLQREREAASLVAKHKDEIAHLKSLATAQETYLTAVRHRWGFEQKEQMKAETRALREELEAAKRGNADFSHQLMCSDELVKQLRSELATLEAQLNQQSASFSEEKRSHDERVRALRLDMRQQQDQFSAHLKAYEEKFAQYKCKTTEEIQMQDILSTRRADALQQMEEERQRHIQARTKPTQRIGDLEEEEENEERFEPADLVKDGKYRKDPMGMDTSWRDYQLNDLRLVPPARRPPPQKFRVDRVSLPRGFGVSCMAPKAVDHQLGLTGQAPLSTRDLPPPRKKEPSERDAVGRPVLGLGLVSPRPRCMDQNCTV